MPLMKATDVYARASWLGRGTDEQTKLWDQHVAQSVFAQACPKVGSGFFYYPQLGFSLRGARALRTIEKGEHVCNIPVDFLLSPYTVGNSTLRPVAAWAYQRRPSQTQIEDNTLLVVFALRELERSWSRWMPYLQIMLSHEVGALPLLWDDASPKWSGLGALGRELASRTKERVLAQYEALIVPALERFPALLSDGLGCGGDAALCPPARLGSVYSWPRFLHVYAIIRARAWGLPMYNTNDDERIFCVPHFDLLNFGQVGISTDFSPAAGGFVATANKRIAAGSELLFHYGRKCREISVNMYGFAPDEARPCGRMFNGNDYRDGRFNSTLAAKGAAVAADKIALVAAAARSTPQRGGRRGSRTRAYAYASRVRTDVDPQIAAAAAKLGMGVASRRGRSSREG